MAVLDLRGLGKSGDQALEDGGGKHEDAAETEEQVALGGHGETKDQNPCAEDEETEHHHARGERIKEAGLGFFGSAGIGAMLVDADRAGIDAVFSPFEGDEHGDGEEDANDDFDILRVL